jgi:MFS family permease
VTRDKGPRLRLAREASGFRLLFLATLASSFGTWLAVVALVVDVYDRTRDATWVSALLIVEFLPVVAIGLLAGPLIDRLPRRSLLVGSDLARLGVFALLAFAGSALHIVLLAFAAGVATSVFRPALYAALPNIVDDEDLAEANGLLQSTENLMWAVGALAGGALVAGAGPEAAYILNAVTFLVSALLIVRIRESFEEEEREPSRGAFADLAEGFSFVFRSRLLLVVLVAWSVVMLGNGGANVAEIVLVKDLGAGDFGYGLLLAAGGVGLVAGSLYGGGLTERLGLRALYAGSIAVMAIGFGAAAVAPEVWLAAGAVAVGAAGNGAAVVCNALLVQRGAPDRFRGRAFAVLMSVTFGILGVGMVAAGVLTNAAGARAVWGGAAGFFLLAATVAYALLADAETAVAAEPVPAED